MTTGTAAALGSAARPCARPEVVALPLHDELILHDERSGQTYVLNSTGARVWTLCDGERTTAAIVQTIASRYGIGEEYVRDDVQELIDGLNRADLIHYQ